MRTKRIISFLLVTILALTITVPALADPVPGTITVKNPNPAISIVGQTYTAYRVFDLKYDASGRGGSGAYAYSLNSDFADLPAAVIAAIPASMVAPATPAKLIAYVTSMSNNSDAMNAFAAVVKDYITAHSGITAAGSAVGALVSTEEKAVISVADLGYFIVLGSANALDEKGDPAGSVVSACALTTTDTTATLNVKADAPSLIKKVLDKADTSIGESHPDTWQDYTDVNIGNVVNFKLTSSVPNMIGYTAYTYTVHDLMSAGLTFDASSVKVYIDDVLISNTKYAVNTPGSVITGSDKYTFDIVFSDFLQWKAQAGKSIVITYNATLNTGAVIGNPGNPNTVNLEYSNNPYSTSTNKTPDDTVVVYTFGISLDKIEAGSSPVKHLPGAKFELYTDAAATTNPVWFVLGTAGSATLPTIYKVVAAGTSGAFKEVTTPVSGLIQFDGLDEGVYYLKETDAPAGYNPLAAPIAIKIDAEYNLQGVFIDLWIADGQGETVLDGSGSAYISLDVENQTGTEFPETGGVGRTIFYTLGAFLMLGAVVVLVARKKVTASK